jgi:hypothetical protein
MDLPFWLGPPFWVVAVLFSIFYGWKARDIFQVEREDESWAYLAHQAWFNFAGSLIGWSALWLEVIRILWFAASGAKLEFEFTDLLLGIIAFVGVAGLLPTTTVGLIQGIRELAIRIAGIGK